MGRGVTSQGHYVHRLISPSSPIKLGVNDAQRTETTPEKAEGASLTAHAFCLGVSEMLRLTKPPVLTPSVPEGIDP